MRSKSILAFLLVLGLVAGTALAAAPSKLSWVKFTTDTKMLLSDGTVLEPGNYLIAKLRSTGQRTTVVVANDPVDKMLGTMLAVPNHSETSGPQGKFVFINGCDNRAPRALKSWWPPNSDTGYDFMFNKKEFDSLQNCNPDVKITQAPMPAPKPAAKPAPAPPPPPPAAEPAPAPAPAPEPAKLPKTASNTPLILLLGVAALAGAGLLRRFAQ